MKIFSQAELFAGIGRCGWQWDDVENLGYRNAKIFLRHGTSTIAPENTPLEFFINGKPAFKASLSEWRHEIDLPDELGDEILIIIRATAFDGFSQCVKHWQVVISREKPYDYVE